MKLPHLIGMQVQLEAEITAGSKSSGLHLFALSFTRNALPSSSSALWLVYAGSIELSQTSN
jgi:hypothetical protein